MPQKTKEEILKMTDEELVAAAERGELGDVDGSDPEQRENEDGEVSDPDDGDEAVDDPPPEVNDKEEGEEEGEQEEGEDDEDGEDEDGEAAELVVNGKKYTKEELASLVEALEGEGRMVPQSRLMEEATARRRAEEANHQLQLKIARSEGAEDALAKAKKAADEAAEAARPKYDFVGKRKEYHQLLKDEEWDKAEALALEIDAEREKQANAERKAAVAAAQAETREEMARIEGRRVLDAIAAQMYAKYPFLNNTAPEADATAIYAVRGIRDDLIARGEPPTEALRKAMQTVGDAELKKRGKAAPAGKRSKEELARRAAALRRAVKANNQQPARPGGAGNRVSKVGSLKARDIRKMTDEEFAAADKRGEIPDGSSPSQRERA